MFYEPAKNDHGLPHNPFPSLIVPRPIGWITTLSKDGKVNLARSSRWPSPSSRPSQQPTFAAARADDRAPAYAASADTT